MESLCFLLDLAVYLSCGGAAFYLRGRKLQRKANYLGSITRVLDLRCLDELLAENTTNLLVVVSGRVGSAAPLNCNGLLGVLVKEKAKLEGELELENGGSIETSFKFLLREKETPWYLEDSTGQVNVLGVQDAEGFYGILNEYVLDMPASELLNGVVLPQGTKVLKHNCHGRALNIGTFLTFVGEAVKDKAGNVMIQSPKEQPFRVYSGEGSFDSMIDELKSVSEVNILIGKIFGTIAVALAVLYGVEYIRTVLLPFVWKKKELRNRSKKPKSNSGKPHQRKESDTSSLPIGLALLLVKDSDKDS
ncbi:hypothetical protein CARUB_v10009854mg [Capsella rubella]|uniref:RING-type E3 ubiquitin transferase n=1 Tax=Capsella rubella TaxID=81985 RepID=R0I3V6_9BRAS|nr:E3 ubiquitin-protein ligase SPL1 [Capsella rubella]EOA36944.1 hypothetical protein CARUB_v10009854mg [Capsella rubella]